MAGRTGGHSHAHIRRDVRSSAAMATVSLEDRAYGAAYLRFSDGEKVLGDECLRSRLDYEWNVTTEPALKCRKSLTRR